MGQVYNLLFIFLFKHYLQIQEFQKDYFLLEYFGKSGVRDAIFVREAGWKEDRFKTSFSIDGIDLLWNWNIRQIALFSTPAINVIFSI